MSANDRRHIVPNDDLIWDVRAPRAKRASAHTEIEAAADMHGGQFVGNAGDAEAVIHGRGGQLRESGTIAPGNDPHAAGHEVMKALTPATVATPEHVWSGRR